VAITIHNPALRPTVLELIDKVNEAGATNGEIPLVEVLGLFANIPQALLNQAASRGNLAFQDGTFRNEGTRFEIKFKAAIGDCKILIPESLQGACVCSPSGFRLSFQPRHTIVGSIKLLVWLKTDLLKIEAAGERIFVEMDNDLASLVVNLKMSPLQ
jgi:hypothetical protein